MEMCSCHFFVKKFQVGGGEGRGRTSAFGIYIFIYILVFSYKLTVSNGFSLTVWKCVAVTFLSSSFEWGGGEERGGGRTSAKVGLSAKFELTCHFMLCFTEGLFVLHTKDLMNYIRYSSATLKKIGSSARFASNYGFFHITTPIRAWIIALGIRARPSPFRRSRAGTHSFYNIASITYRWHGNPTHRSPTTPVHSANHDNLLLIKTINNCSKLQSPVFSTPIKDLHSALINCRSVVNKTQDTQLELVINNLDLCILTETWIREDDTTTPGRLCPHGYKALSISRHGRTSGGIAIIYKNDLNINVTKGQPLETMESTCFSINTGFRVVNLIAIYRPPDSNALEFCNELANLLEYKN